jgi:ribosome-binding factor A
MRSQLSKDSSMRMVPQLKFLFDKSVGRGRYMEDLIGRAVAADGAREDSQANE